MFNNPDFQAFKILDRIFVWWLAPIVLILSVFFLFYFGHEVIDIVESIRQKNEISVKWKNFFTITTALLITVIPASIFGMIRNHLDSVKQTQELESAKVLDDKKRAANLYIKKKNENEKH